MLRIFALARFRGSRKFDRGLCIFGTKGPKGKGWLCFLSFILNTYKAAEQPYLCKRVSPLRGSDHLCVMMLSHHGPFGAKVASLPSAKALASMSAFGLRICNLQGCWFVGEAHGNSRRVGGAHEGIQMKSKNNYQQRRCVGFAHGNSPHPQLCCGWHIKKAKPSPIGTKCRCIFRVGEAHAIRI